MALGETSGLLSVIDHAVGATLILPTSTLKGPLTGYLAALDWRLRGRLSQRVISGRYTGQAGERLLLLFADEAWPTVLLLGMGERVDPDHFSASLSQVRGLTGNRRVWLPPNPCPSGWSPAVPRWLASAGEDLVEV